MKKILLISVISLFALLSLSFDISYKDLNDNLSMIINDEEISADVFKAQTGIVTLLGTIKNTNESFFQTLTNTATGLELINTYNKRKALDFSGNILFIQFVENKGIELNREDLKNNINSQFDKIVKDSNLSDEDLNKYLVSKGYASKEAYLEEQFYNGLYQRAIQKYYEKKSQEYNISDEEIKNEYDSNKETYIQPPQAEISVIKFETSEEASLTYNKITQGYYQFEEVYNEKKNDNTADNMTINLNVNNNQFVTEVKNNAPGYISKPEQVDDNSWMLIKIMKKTPQKQLSLEEAKNQIIFNLRDKKAKDYFDKILPDEFKKFKDNSNITLNKKLFY